MIAQVNATKIHSAEIALPSSKSISNRLLLIRILSEDKFSIENLSDSDDTEAMLNALKSDLRHIDVGAAGTSMRFLTAFLSLTDGEHTITGSERMKRRPIAVLVDGLRKLGADIVYTENEGFPPLNINGHKLRGGNITLQGNVSSQYISALMLIAPYIETGLTITLEGKIVSRPYISMTLNLMRQFGANVEWEDNVITIKPQKYNGITTYTIESDWSAASYWYSIAALCRGTQFVLKGLFEKSLQGDSEVQNIAKHFGVETNFGADGIEIVANKSFSNYFEYDFNSQPDLAQTFVVLACLLDIRFKYTGLESLVIKETNRIAALVDEMAKLGYILETNHQDTILWQGERCEASLKPISTYNDHRMAMAFAPAAIKFGRIEIEDPMVVSKSYLHFWDDIAKCGICATLQ